MKKLMFLISLILFVATAQGISGVKKKSGQAANQVQPEVRGLLGTQFGEIISIEGVITDGSTLKTKRDSGKLMIRITSINGTMIQGPILIPVDYFTWGRVKKPKINETKKYIGYETGGFKGIPAKAFNNLPQATAESFHFETYFQVCDELD